MRVDPNKDLKPNERIKKLCKVTMFNKKRLKNNSLHLEIRIMNSRLEKAPSWTME